MNIGILTYHSACNYGANLQTLSTIGKIKSLGFRPIIINWKPQQYEEHYRKTVPPIQYECHSKFCADHYIMTNKCIDEEDIRNEIRRKEITSVIIGSDAVLTIIPKLARIVFPTKKIFNILEPTEDRKFPNAFWGSFYNEDIKNVKMILMSVSSQNTEYGKILPYEKNMMANMLCQYSMITVRDNWTKKMVEKITEKEISPEITPDPVFGFNSNFKEQITREEILNKYHLADNYILISFHKVDKILYELVMKIKCLARELGIEVYHLPMPSNKCELENIKKIPLPLSPLEWYSLIKYSRGYIGHNMHPVIVCLHNSIPFYCIDHYGINHLRIYQDEKSSKIYDLLNIAGFEAHRISTSSLIYKRPKASNIINKIIEFNHENCVIFQKYYLDKYNSMMNQIYNIMI